MRGSKLESVDNLPIDFSVATAAAAAAGAAAI